MRGELRVVEDVPAAFRDLVAQARPRTLALSGGGTARRCYERLAAVGGLDWAGVEVLISDERWVPVAHEDSNEGMARRVLLDHVAAKAVHSLREAGPTPAAAAAAYDRLVAGLDGLDVVHLGLGADGHTASLFPASPALAVRDRYVVATGDDAHDWERVTFTYAGIARGRLVVVTASGADKRAALRRVRDGDATAPAARIEADTLVWLADAAAAG